MKNNAKRFLAGILGLAMLVGFALNSRAQTAAPKRLLVVTVAKTFGHASIPTGLKVTAELAKKTGQFTLDYAGTDQELAEKTTPEALKKYDGVFFLSTTGELPMPDKAAFLNWIKSGKGFIGAHAATDTFHGNGQGVDPYIDMIGGEFVTHTETTVECIVEDPSHPATRDLGKTWKVMDEIYFMKNFSRDKVHMLLSLDKEPGSNRPGYFPIAWCKKYGEGRVFYTALGHEDAMWLNPQFQQHLLGGIQWALGLEKGDATPQTATANAGK